jgi:small neutral amino acid transporter SnatA (MarC family)
MTPEKIVDMFSVLLRLVDPVGGTPVFGAILAALAVQFGMDG